MADLVDATWARGYSVQAVDGTVINPGDKYKVGRAEAEASDDWEVPVPAAKPVKASSEAVSTDAG